jgi:hypothetical protein
LLPVAASVAEVLVPLTVSQFPIEKRKKKRFEAQRYNCLIRDPDLNFESVEEPDGEPVEELDGEPVESDGEPVEEPDGESVKEPDGESVESDGEPVEEPDGDKS